MRWLFELGLNSTSRRDGFLIVSRRDGFPIMSNRCHRFLIVLGGRSRQRPPIEHRKSTPRRR
jgi:hypothetical protein